MNYTKEMIDLVREIRKRVPSDAKPGVKLANPELLNEIQDVYETSKDAVLKALTRELFAMAGEEWVDKLANKKKSEERMQTKTYRGQSSLSSTPVVSNEPVQEANDIGLEGRPKRVYRGQIVA